MRSPDRFRMLRVVAVAFLSVALPLGAANSVRLFLTDGDSLLVREYEVQEDRVRYYSMERSQWEEIPVSLIDLDKTRRIEQEQQAARDKREKEERIERAAERRARTELHRVPIEDGVYYLDGEEVATVPQSEVTTESSKGRTLLQIIAPVPIIAGKQTVELEGTQSDFVVRNSRPMFYMRLETINRFGIVRLKEKKKARLVQVIQVVPKSKEMFEEQEEVEVFRQQFAPGVYKIWPVNPLPAGEYAIIDYTPGEADIRVWDFSCQHSEAIETPESSSDESDKDP